MKGASNARPPIPKYRYIWDIDMVLNRMKELGINQALDFKTLSLKLVTLLGLCNVPRSQELGALDINFMSRTNECYTFGFGVSVKHRKRGKAVPTISFYPFKEDEKLCPVQALDNYLDRTESIRDLSESTQFFLSVLKPHKPVTRTTLAKWVVNFLRESGVNTSKFKGHSMRHASTSKADLLGASLKDILGMGNWSSESVWQKHYHKPIETPHKRYQHVLLGSAGQKL